MKLHRLAYLVTASLSIFLTILAIVHGDGDPSEYCTNEKCINIASELLRSQNHSVNPCDNFYAHVCTGQKGSHLFYTNVKVQKQISELLKNVQPSDMEALRKAMKFQDACTDKDARTRRGLTPIVRILSDNGEWPVAALSNKSESQNNRYRSWQEMHENFAKHTGISALFDVTVEIDRNNNGVHILSLGVPTVPSERVHFVARTKRETRSPEYREYLTGVVEEMKQLRGFDAKHDDLLANPEGIIGFEDELVKLAVNLDTDYHENGDDLRITTIETLQNEWDAVVPRISNYSMNWLKVINDRFEGTDIVVDASEKIALKPAAFVANFTRLLMNTPVQTIVNYIHWKVIDNLLPAVPSQFWNPHAQPRAFAMSYAGGCVVKHKMIHAVAYIYVKNHFSLQSKTAALELVRRIEIEVKREIGESSWLDEATKSVAQKKMDAMRNLVGYPEWYEDPGKIDEYYRELTVGPDHFENILAYNKFEAKKQMSKLRSPVDETAINWTPWPYIVNAEYIYHLNAFSIPASILQSPFFDYERPSVLNYGALGAFAGHEICHGFDSHGRIYDESAVKRKWWSQSAIDTYKAKAECFVKQFDAYTVNILNETVHLNGTETLGENMADTMGFRVGLRAYQTLKKDGKTNNVKIEMLGNFTDEQLYFYQLAYSLCEPRPVDTLERGQYAHSPKLQRINGALANLQEFADAFNCPLGSPMNPPEKCLVWD